MKEHHVTVKVREYEPGKDKYMPLRQGIGEGSIGDDPVEISSNCLNGELILAFREGTDWWILDMEGFVRAVVDHRARQGVAQSSQEVKPWGPEQEQAVKSIECFLAHPTDLDKLKDAHQLLSSLIRDLGGEI